LAVGIWSALFVADALLIARSLSIASLSVVPSLLATVSMVVVATASTLACLAIRAASLRQVSADGRGWIPYFVSAAASVLWCLPLVVTAAPLTVGLMLGVLLVQGILLLAVALSNDSIPMIEQHSAPLSLPSISPDHPIEPTTISQAESYELDDEDEPEFLPEVELIDSDEAQLTQWMSRRDTDDTEVIEGWMRVTFQTGQREATLHVSFCPPLSSAPIIETEDIEGSDVEIRVASAFPFGLRMTVRRSSALNEPLIARIGFFASATPARKAA
jgi:hypothetical protein